MSVWRSWLWFDRWIPCLPILYLSGIAQESIVPWGSRDICKSARRRRGKTIKYCKYELPHDDTNPPPVKQNLMRRVYILLSTPRTQRIIVRQAHEPETAPVSEGSMRIAHIPA